MKIYVKFGLIIFVIVAISCGLLAYVNAKTYDLIMQNQIIAENEARALVLPNAFRFQKIVSDTIIYYEGYDASETLVGYALIANQNGYSGEIQIMVGVNLNLKINKVVILTQTETPGLGSNCKKPEFLNQFVNISLQDLILDKNGGKIISITGATITSRAIVKSIKEKLDLLLMVLNPQDINNFLELNLEIDLNEDRR